ncbi:MAG: hypothetical protein S4CHLAM20_00640 [Chlamydiia bacterium]|nr:hypothetical protein [Chlamydiia bacterium]
MKKLWISLICVLTALILAIVLGYIFIATILGSILTSTFGTKTTVANAALTPTFLKLWHLKVANPPNAKEPYALTIGRIKLKAPITTYLSQNVMIDKISLDDLTLVLEYFPGKKRLTNWDEIINHVNSTNTTSSSKKNTGSTTIKELTINNIVIKTIDPAGKVTTTKIKTLTFNNLSTEKGDITAQIAKTILIRMLLNIQDYVKFPIDLTKETINEPIKDGSKILEDIFPKKN